MLEVILVSAAVASAIGVTIWRSIAREKLRTRTLSNLATGLGFSMVREGTTYRFDSPVFHKGDKGRNRIRNAMEGTMGGLPAVLFDFSYEIDRGGEDGTVSTWHTVAAFAFRGTDFPSFSITKSGFLSRRAEHKVEIEGNPEFSERFVVTGRDKLAVQKLLNPGLIQSVVSGRQSEKLVIEGAGPWLVLYRTRRRIRPEQWKDFLDETSTIATAWLRHCNEHQTASPIQLTFKSTRSTQYSRPA